MTDAERNERLLDIAMEQPDLFAAEVRYLDNMGNLTRRIVSPIKYRDGLLLVYCFGREALRTLRPDSIWQVRLVFASEVLPPMPIYRRKVAC